MQWWIEGDDRIWMEDPDYTEISSIWPLSVITSFPTFEEDGYMISHRDRANLLAECYVRRHSDEEF